MALGVGEIAGLGTGAIQSGLGILDMFRSRRQRKEAEQLLAENPYDIPSAKKSALGVAERQAGTMRLPAEDLRRAQIGEATAAGVGAARDVATSSSDVLSTLAQLYGGKQMAEQNLAIEGAQRYDQNQLQLQRALGLYGDEQAKKWDITVLQPYNQRMAQAEAYSTRGRQGLSAGLGAVGNTVGGMITQQGAQNRFDQYMDYLTGSNTTDMQPIMNYNPPAGWTPWNSGESYR